MKRFAYDLLLLGLLFLTACTQNTSVNQAPLITTPANQQHEVNDTVALQILAIDAEQDPLSYRANNLPDGVTINTTGLIAGTLTTQGRYKPVITVSDNQGNNSSVTFVWQVDSLPNQAPVITPPGNQQNTVGESVLLSLVVTDPEQDSVLFSASGLPDGLSISDAGVITGTLGAAGAFTPVVRVDDSQGNHDEVSFNWQVLEQPNQAPTIDVMDDQTNTVGDSVTVPVSARDPDGDVLTFVATGLPDGVTVSNAGVLSGTLTQAGVFNVSISVTDPELASATTTFTWQVNNVPVAPVLTIVTPEAITQADDNVGDPGIPEEDRPAPEDEIIGLGAGWRYEIDANNKVLGGQITGVITDDDSDIAAVFLSLTHDAADDAFDGSLNLNNLDVTGYTQRDTDGSFRLQLTEIFRDNGDIPQAPIPAGPFKVEDGEPAADSYEIPLCVFLEPEFAEEFIISGLAGKFLGVYTLSMHAQDDTGLQSAEANVTFEVWCAPVIDGDGRVRPNF